jgi:hypothetical protein
MNKFYDSLVESLEKEINEIIPALQEQRKNYGVGEKYLCGVDALKNSIQALHFLKANLLHYYSE